MSIVIGLIGAGFMGKTHAAAFTKLHSARIAYVADVFVEKAQALANGMKGCGVNEVEAILTDPQIDLVDITVPTLFHPQYVIQALEAGKHVIVEKPLALNLDEANRMVDAARRSGKFLMVAHVLRFWPEYVAIRAVLRGGRIGNPRLASAYRLSSGPQWAPWFRDPMMSGGAVLDLQIHDLDMFNWLFGKPQSVTARGYQDERGAWSHVLSLVTYPKVQAFTEASYLYSRDYPFSAGMRVVCEQGVIEYQFRAGGARLEQGQPTSYLQIHQDGKPSQMLQPKPGNGYENEIAYFVECVEQNRPPQTVTPEDARLAIKLALASRESMETGQPAGLIEEGEKSD